MSAVRPTAAARHGRDRRLPERRQVDADQPADRDARGGRARDAGDDARPQGARLRVERQAVPADRHRRRRHREPATRSRARSPSRRARRSPRPTSSCFVVDARAGVTPGDEELAEILRRVAQAGAPAREQDRRPARRSRSRSSSTASASATRSRSPAMHGTAPATCSTRSSTGCRARRAADGASATRRSASRSSAGRTSASRRSSTRCSAPSGRSSRRCRARRATRSTPSSSAATGRSC